MQALVIDDTRVMRMVMRGAMQQLGFTVSEAGNGREGLERLEASGRPDVVLVDCYMPEMDGIEFVRRVRQNPALRGLRVILVTGESESAVTDRALAEGADAFVMKPFTKELILTQLVRLGIA